MTLKRKRKYRLQYLRVAFVDILWYLNHSRGNFESTHTHTHSCGGNRKRPEIYILTERWNEGKRKKIKFKTVFLQNNFLFFCSFSCEKKTITMMNTKKWNVYFMGEDSGMKDGNEKKKKQNKIMYIEQTWTIVINTCIVP